MMSDNPIPLDMLMELLSSSIGVRSGGCDESYFNNTLEHINITGSRAATTSDSKSFVATRCSWLTEKDSKATDTPEEKLLAYGIIDNTLQKALRDTDNADVSTIISCLKDELCAIRGAEHKIDDTDVIDFLMYATCTLPTTSYSPKKMDMLSTITSLFMSLTGGPKDDVDHLVKCSSFNQVGDVNELRMLNTANTLVTTEFNIAAMDGMGDLRSLFGYSFEEDLLPVVIFITMNSSLDKKTEKFVMRLVREHKSKAAILENITPRIQVLTNMVTERQTNIRDIIKYEMFKRIYSNDRFQRFGHTVCVTCNKFAATSCSCGRVRYCCKDHQKLNWGNHRAEHKAVMEKDKKA